MKTCTKCGEDKPLDEFKRDVRYKGGRVNWCRCCLREYNRQRRKANPEKARDAARRYWARNVEKERERGRRYYAENREKEATRHREYAARRAEHLTRYKAEYRERNAPLFAAHAAHRRAALAARTPLWADLVAIAAFYEQAARVSKCLGVPHHVDHIVPLKGRRVSGLHVALNLRVVPAVVNLRKRNSFEVAA